MTYINPQATAIPTIGLDGTITSLQTDLSALTWLSKCFHRAYRHSEQSQSTNNRTNVVPKTWEAGNEWINVLPNDNLPAQAFFYPISDEDVTEFDNQFDPLMEADICLIVWVNTTQLVNHTTGPSLAYEKADVINVLKASDLVLSIDSIVDRSAAEIFDPFTVDDVRNHFTMLPFAGFRVNFKVKFDYIECSTISS